MRLLHVTNLTMHEFFGNSIPKYAILSHRWENEEVTFQDFRDGKGPEMAGWSKVTGCCAQAVLDGWDYVWIDSCCIDKSSSAELSEAINSMFRWYESAQVCYAYLSDVQKDSANPVSFQLWDSKWFKRGWTLQELLAPYYVDFFDYAWKWLGSKATLDELLRNKTGVLDFSNYKSACIAQKMSWASSRETTRIEDQSYSLMGLFGVYMPPLYGEGENAFRRLQMEIISKTDDDSILAFAKVQFGGLESVGDVYTILATSPKDFAYSGSIVRDIWDPDRPVHTMSSKGLCVHSQLVSLQGKQFAPLNCTRKTKDESSNSDSVVGFNVLQKAGSNTWLRSGFLEKIKINKATLAKDPRAILYAERNGPRDNWPPVNYQFNILMGSLSVAGFFHKKYEAIPVPKYGQESLWFLREDLSKLTLDFINFDEEAWKLEHASVLFENRDQVGFKLVFGLLGNQHPWIDIVVINELSGSTTDWPFPTTKQDLVLGRDRISRRFLKGALNARVKGLPSFLICSFSVDLTFDPEPKWSD